MNPWAMNPAELLAILALRRRRRIAAHNIPAILEPPPAPPSRGLGRAERRRLEREQKGRRP